MEMSFGLSAARSSIEARDLLEIVEARHKRTSAIFISQFTPAGWHGKIGEETLVDASLITFLTVFRE
jgi:hypothetical protein